MGRDFINFLFNQFREGDPLRKVANARQQNRIANILNDFFVEGGTIHKPTDKEGLGWGISIPPLTNETIEAILESDSTSDVVRGIAGGLNLTFPAKAEDGTYDVVLNSSIDWRCRHIEAWIVASLPAESSAPTVGEKFVGASISGSVTLATAGVYTLYVATNGNLKISASGAGDQAVVWVRASDRLCVPDSCPAGLDDTYLLSVRRLEYSGGTCAGDPITDTSLTNEPLLRDGDLCRWVGGGYELTLDTANMRWKLTDGDLVAVRSTGATPVGAWPDTGCQETAGGSLSGTLTDIAIAEAT